METTALQPSVEVLQNDVVDLLGQVCALTRRASQALSADKSSEAYAKKYADFQAGVAEALENVKNLELVMSIVAPMKAGKSTIINAVVGQDLLPSRNAAMTTLPTAILFDAKLEFPLLTLSDEIISVFQETLAKLRAELKANGIEWARDQVAQQPSAEELRTLLEQIATSSCTHFIQPETSGCESIKSVLIGLNDIARLCSAIDPSLDPQGRLTDIPRIRTPFWDLQQETNQSSKMGNLVIVDTPGPNESGEHLRLSAVVEEQLKKSSIVLIVLDFTQLNNQAAAEVRKQVGPIIRLLGKENLYAIINKVDQRRKGDMTPEQVQKFVAADLQLSDSTDVNRVFEVSAIRAFCAARFMMEKQQRCNQQIDIEAADLETAEALAQEALGARWKEKLQRVSVEDLQEEAEYLWDDSGFRPFLKKAVSALMESAAPRTMNSALNRSQKVLTEFRDDVQLRLSALISQDTEKLQCQLNALKEDLRHLELCRGRLQEVDKVKKQLQRNLKEILEVLKHEAKLSIIDHFTEKDHERAQPIQKLDMKVRKALLTDVGGFETFPSLLDWLPESIKSTLKHKTSEVISFSSQAEAEKFATQASDYARQSAESLLSTARKNTAREIETARTNLQTFLKNETTHIIERARNRLNEAFGVELSLPSPPAMTSEATDSFKFQVNRQTKEVSDYRIEKYRPFYFLWLIEQERKVPILRTEAYYTVSLETLVTQFNQSIEANVDSINQKIVKYLDEGFQWQINVYFEHLDRYLNSYRESLKRAQIDQSLPIKEKTQLKGELQFLVPQAEEQIQKAVVYLERTKNFMPKKD